MQIEIYNEVAHFTRNMGQNHCYVVSNLCLKIIT